MIRQEQCIQTDHLCFGSEERAEYHELKRCKVWKLRDDVTAGIFKERVQTRVSLVVEKPADVEDVFKNFKECLIEEAVEVGKHVG